MYQVFVVEDELLIRQSIRNAVENMQGPYMCCGEAADGEIALSIIQDLMPDILLTDIRMPFLDGFELIRNVRGIMPWVKIIIISGYGDFEYAQKAISLGANKYLLKPLRPNDLKTALEDVTRQIEEEKTGGSLPAGYGEDEMRAVLRRDYMSMLLSGGADTALLLERARTLELEVSHPMYQVAVFGFEDVKTDANGFRKRLEGVLLEAGVKLYHINEMNQLAVVVCGSGTEQLNEETWRLVNIIRRRLTDPAPVITTVVGDTVPRLSAVSEAYRRAGRLLRDVSALAAGKVIDIRDKFPVTSEQLNLQSVFDAAFQQKLLTCPPDRIGELMKGYLADERFGSVLIRYCALTDLITMGASGEGRDMFKTASDRAEFERTAETLMLEIVNGLRESAASRVPPVIARADSYVAENFKDPNISLIQVAKHVGMSPAHFSTVFSQAHGVPFIGYLTQMRIEHAKKLLSETDMKLSAIALEIGYNEPNYFSHVFRKNEGMTPKEYRQSKGNDAN